MGLKKGDGLLGTTKIRRKDMEKKYDVVALGELLIDFTENGLSSQGNPLMEQIRGERPAMYWLC